MSKTLIIGTIAVMVGIFALGGFLLWQQSQSPASEQQTPLAPAPQSEVLNMSNWQTYRNAKFGFEVRYPEGFTPNTSGPNYVQQALERGEQISGTVAPSLETVTLQSFEGGEFFVIIFHSTEAELSEEGYQDSLYLFGPCDLRWGFEVSSIGKRNVFSDSVLVVQGRNIAPELGHILACAYLKNRVGNLVVMGGEASVLFDQILATFRFIDSDDPRASCDKKLVQSDQDSEKETALFCQDGDNPSGFVLLLDMQNGEEKEIWRKDLISDQSVGNLRVSDVDGDGTDEVLYEEFGTTACCGLLSQYLYSPKYGQEFIIIRDSGTNAQTLEPFCSITYSENLQQPQYQIFKEFLDEEVSCSDN